MHETPLLSDLLQCEIKFNNFFLYKITFLFCTFCTSYWQALVSDHKSGDTHWSKFFLKHPVFPKKNITPDFLNIANICIKLFIYF